MVFHFLVIVTQMPQPAVLTPGLFRQVSLLGMNDTWAAMIFVNSAFILSFAVWNMHSLFAGIRCSCSSRSGSSADSPREA